MQWIWGLASGNSSSSLLTSSATLGMDSVLDGDEHFQAVERMVFLLSNGDPRKDEEAAVSAAEALEVRLAFWDVIPTRMSSIGYVSS